MSNRGGNGGVGRRAVRWISALLYSEENVGVVASGQFSFSSDFVVGCTMTPA